MSCPKMYNMKLAFAMINMSKNNTNYERKLRNAIKNKCRDHCYKDSSSTKSYFMFSVLQTTVRKSHGIQRGRVHSGRWRALNLTVHRYSASRSASRLASVSHFFLFVVLISLLSHLISSHFSFSCLAYKYIYIIFWRPASLTPYRIIILMTKSCKVL